MTTVGGVAVTIHRPKIVDVVIFVYSMGWWVDTCGMMMTTLRSDGMSIPKPDFHAQLVVVLHGCESDG